MIELAGERVTLREIREEDAERVVCWRNAERANKVFFSDELLTLGRQKAWMERYRENPSDITFIIEHEGRPIGMAALYDIRGETAEFGRLLIGEVGFRGRGLAREAARAVLDYGFRDIGLKTIRARVYGHNAPAVALYVSLGFRVSGVDKYGGDREVLNMSVSRPLEG